MQVWNDMCCPQLAEMQDAKNHQKSGHSGTTVWGCIFAIKACINNRKKLLNSRAHIPQYGEHRCTNGWDRFTSLGHPNKFQRVSRLAFVTAATSLTGGQPNFARWPSAGLVHCIYILRGSCPLTEFYQVQNSLYVPNLVLLYWQRYCTALQQQTSAKLCGVVQEMELRNFHRGRHLYSAGRPSRWALAHISS